VLSVMGCNCNTAFIVNERDMEAIIVIWWNIQWTAEMKRLTWRVAIIRVYLPGWTTAEVLIHVSWIHLVSFRRRIVNHQTRDLMTSHAVRHELVIYYLNTILAGWRTRDGKTWQRSAVPAEPITCRVVYVNDLLERRSTPTVADEPKAERHTNC
jgi:hypothetical protein